MRAKILEREQAIALRRMGETIPNIAKQLKISKASVSLWMKGVSIPDATVKLMQARMNQNRLLAHDARREITRNKLAQTAAEAHEVIARIDVNPEYALILCSLMYWCEGTKSKNDGEFTFTNADPLMIRGFLSLLRRAVPIDESRIRIKMHLHEYHDEDSQRLFWSKVTGVPTAQFQKTFWKPRTGKSLKPGYPGCVHVRYHDVALSRKIHATARAFLERLDMLQ